MSWRWLFCVGVLLAASSVAPGQTPGVELARAPVTQVGHLVVAAPAVPAATTVNALPYQPQPGDIILYDDNNRFFHLIFRLAHTAPPTHTALVIAAPDGQPALLELTGPKVVTARVTIMDVESRFRSYPGTVWVRKIRAPLTTEQSKDLTQFAEAQAGKGFALSRVLLMGTPLCPRVGLRQELFGHTHMSRNRWFCSELVVAGCAHAKILDGKRCSANATLPHDLAVDERLNLSGLYHPPAVWLADAPLIQHVEMKR